MSQAAEAPPEGTVRDWLDRRAADGGTAFVLPEGGAALSWANLREDAERVARMLDAEGAARGESIAILQPNGRDAMLALFGALYGGYRATMINLVAGPEAVGYALEHCEARRAFVHASAEGLFAEASGSARGIACLDIGAEAGAGALHAIAADDDAMLMYTSGTTGRPKGVRHSHASLLAGGWTPTIAHRLTESDRGLCVLPVYHINGLCVTVMGALVSGGSLALCPRFSASRFWAQAAESEATWFSVVPTIISHLLHGEPEPDAATRGRIRFGRSASSALAPEVQRAFEERFGIPIVETMGLTETAAQILSNPLPPGPRKIGSPGIAYGNEARVIAPDGRALGPGESGEIVVRGPNVMRGYLKNPEATASAFTADGWLRTGDLGHCDSEGYFFVTGRLKELIIKGGENIAPREIDEALYAHGDVIEAAAFARPCAVYGERVEAAVKLRSGSTLTAEELIALCTRHLGAFKSPERIHILEDLPKGPSGKIQRLKLAELT